MNVYVKKKDRIIDIPGIVAPLIYMCFSLIVFICLVRYIMEATSFIDILYDIGVDFIVISVLSVSSFGISVYFFFYIVYYLFYFFIKGYPKYEAKLLSKKNEIYNGEQITYMKFRTSSRVFKCYTIGENNLVVKNKYLLRVNNIIWKPKYVEEINSPFEKIEQSRKIDYEPKYNFMFIVLFILILILVGIIGVCILGMVMQPEFRSTYMIIASIITITLCIIIGNIN